MRTMNCKNVRREVDEAAPGDLLSAFARRHMSACRECRSFCEEHQKLQTMLSSLGTIEAPGDFDFRLRARLAREKAGSSHFPLSNLSFGFRAAVVAVLLVVFGSVAFLNFKPSSNNSLVANNATVDGQANQPVAVEAPQSKQVVANGTTPVAANEGNIVPKRQVAPKLGALASARNTPRMGTRDMGSMPAKIIKASELNARVADYPIESSSQPMKVSLDNGRGSSRTISLPPVSYGSQRVMAQGSAPLMASARGSW
jgi:hypothetical protein